MVDEARLEQSDAGLVAATDGWFVVNVRDGAWLRHETFGDAFVVEGPAARFPDVGYTLAVIPPGRPNGLYHAESNQEDFLVLSGECLLLVEGQERRLRAWDFVHCPAGTEHIFVGAGEEPCVVFMTGARTREKALLYPRSELALRHGAGAEAETRSASDAYAPFPSWAPRPPERWDGMPWA